MLNLTYSVFLEKIGNLYNLMAECNCVPIFLLGEFEYDSIKTIIFLLGMIGIGFDQNCYFSIGMIGICFNQNCSFSFWRIGVSFN